MTTKCPTLEDAIHLALEAHKGQKYGEEPYILHPIRVMLALGLEASEEEKMIAVLHDSVEDSNGVVTIDRLIDLGYSPFVFGVIALLTRKSDENYESYITSLLSCTGPAAIAARKVKLRDLEDNMDVRRLRNMRGSDSGRLARYQKAWHRISDYIKEKER